VRAARRALTHPLPVFGYTVHRNSRLPSGHEASGDWVVMRECWRLSRRQEQSFPANGVRRRRPGRRREAELERVKRRPAFHVQTPCRSAHALSSARSATSPSASSSSCLVPICCTFSFPHFRALPLAPRLLEGEVEHLFLRCFRARPRLGHRISPVAALPATTSSATQVVFELVSQVGSAYKTECPGAWRSSRRAFGLAPSPPRKHVKPRGRLLERAPHQLPSAKSVK